jgi:uncharacterized membrane protein
MSFQRVLIFGLIFSLFLISVNALPLTDIKVDLVDNTPYIDYTIIFDSNFTIDLPDFDDLIYAKILPNDIHYEIKNGKLIIIDNKKGTIVFKYQGTPFLSTVNSYEKTLAFDLIGSTNIQLTSDTNIETLKPEPIIEDSEYYNWQTSEKSFVLYIVLHKNPFDWRVISIIIICLVIIGFLILPKYIIKYFPKKENKNKEIMENKKEENIEERETLFLDDNQKGILALLKREKATTQQSIADTLNIKKSHMSKILNKMERNNLIERKKVGKVNKIILAEKK